MLRGGSAGRQRKYPFQTRRPADGLQANVSKPDLTPRPGTLSPERPGLSAPQGTAEGGIAREQGASG